MHLAKESDMALLAQKGNIIPFPQERSDLNSLVSMICRLPGVVVDREADSRYFNVVIDPGENQNSTTGEVLRLSFIEFQELGVNKVLSTGRKDGTLSIFFEIT